MARFFTGPGIQLGKVWTIGNVFELPDWRFDLDLARPILTDNRGQCVIFGSKPVDPQDCLMAVYYNHMTNRQTVKTAIK
jgi:hypothetical protein